jgi:hypothetical protein
MGSETDQMESIMEPTTRVVLIQVPMEQESSLRGRPSLNPTIYDLKPIRTE